MSRQKEDERHSCTKRCSSNVKEGKDQGNQTNRWFSSFVLVLCFFSQALSMGFFVSFGTIYVELINVFETTETRAAWIGSIAISVCFALGSVSSVLTKRFGCGTMISIGGVLLGTGLFLSSKATNIMTLTLTFSGLTSIGCSFLFFASLSTLPHFFKSGLCIATSIACSGTNFSGISFSPLMVHLIKRYNFRKCFQIFSMTALVPILGGLILQKYDPQSTSKENECCRKYNSSTTVSIRSLANNRRFLLVCLAMSMIELCYYIPYVHIVNYGLHNGVPLLKASWLPVTLSIGGWVGKIVFGLIGQIQYVNIFYLFQIFLLAMAVCLTLLPLATTFLHLMWFSVVYGVFDGAFTGYILPIVAETVAPEQIGVALGAMYTFMSVEMLFGAPLAGFIYSSTASYQVPFMLCGGIILLASLVFFWISPEQCEEKSIDQSAKAPLTESKVDVSLHDTNKKNHEEKGPPIAVKHLLVKLKTDRNSSSFVKKVLKVFYWQTSSQKYIDQMASPLITDYYVIDSDKNAPLHPQVDTISQPHGVDSDHKCSSNKNMSVNETRESFSSSSSSTSSSSLAEVEECCSCGQLDNNNNNNNGINNHNGSKIDQQKGQRLSLKDLFQINNANFPISEGGQMGTNVNRPTPRLMKKKNSLIELSQQNTTHVALTVNEDTNDNEKDKWTRGENDTEKNVTNSLYYLRVFTENYVSVLRKFVAGGDAGRLSASNPSLYNRTIC